MTTQPDQQNGDGLPDLTPEFLQLAAANLERVFMSGANLTDGQLKVVNQSAAYLRILATQPARDAAEGTLTHTRSCAALGGYESDCSCCLKERTALATEQAMHRAWRKRAEEAEAQLAAPPKPAPDAKPRTPAMEGDGERSTTDIP